MRRIRPGARENVRPQTVRKEEPEGGREETVRVITVGTVRRGTVRTADRGETARAIIAETVRRAAVRKEGREESVRATTGITAREIVQTITVGIVRRGTVRTADREARAVTTAAGVRTVPRADVRTAGEARAEGIPSAVR